MMVSKLQSSVAARRAQAGAAGIALSAVLLMSIAACGQKGPLTLPKPAGVAAPAAAASAP